VSVEHDLRRPRVLYVIAAATFLVFAQAFMVAPLIPRFAQVFSTTPETMGLAIPLYLIPYGLMTLVGDHSDRLGRGNVILCSLTAFVVLMGASSAVSSATAFLTSRSITAIGASGIVPIALDEGAAQGLGQGDEVVLPDKSLVHNAVRAQSQRVFGDEPTNTELDDWTSWTMKVNRKMQRHGRPPADATMASEERFIEKFAKPTKWCSTKSSARKGTQTSADLRSRQVIVSTRIDAPQGRTLERSGVMAPAPTGGRPRQRRRRGQGESARGRSCCAAQSGACYAGGSLSRG